MNFKFELLLKMAVVDFLKSGKLGNLHTVVWF